MTGGAPVSDAVILVDGRRIRSIAPRRADPTIPEDAEVIDAAGQYVVPGLMDANVHLFMHVPDLVLEYEGRYQEIIEEAAQVALRSGVTSVFDTWGPLEPLTTVRDRINRGEVVGSRMFIAGHIIGFGGPFSADGASPGGLLGPDGRTDQPAVGTRRRAGPDVAHAGGRPRTGP
jgi:imidazolonepropionase-like amidohydrolase